MLTFISYSRANSDFAVRLAKDLKAAGLDVWLDQLDIPTGARWDDEIEKALEKSAIFLIILSPESTQSQNVKDEVGYAIDAGKKILPVTIKNCNVPLRLRRFQYVDFSNKLYEDSLTEIKHLLTAPSNLMNENNPDYTAVHFAGVDDNKTKSQRPREPLCNKTLIMLAVACFVVIAIAVGFVLSIKSAPVVITANDTSQNTQTAIPYATQLGYGSGNSIDASPTAYIPVNPTVPPTKPVVPTKSPIPRIFNFSACADPCNGNNSITAFPSAAKKIYLEWGYENIPYGAHYVRKWTMDGREWIKYDCTWTGSENGKESVKLTEPKGLHSGTWEITIIVNEQVLLKEQINVSGNWDYWDPAGTLNSCFGTTD